MTIEQVNKSILELESPDLESRSPEEGGRRIIRLDEHRAWGWRIVNHKKYRSIRSEEDRREQNRIAQEKFRNKNKAPKSKISNSKPSVSKSNTQSAQSAQAEAEAEAEVEAEAIKNTSASDDAGIGVEYSKAFITFWDMYPVKKNKGLAFKSFKKIKPAEYPAIKSGLLAAQKSEAWIKDNGKFIPHPSSWLNARGWEDETCTSAKPFNKEEWLKNI